MSCRETAARSSSTAARWAESRAPAIRLCASAPSAWLGFPARMRATAQKFEYAPADGWHARRFMSRPSMIRKAQGSKHETLSHETLSNVAYASESGRPTRRAARLAAASAVRRAEAARIGWPCRLELDHQARCAWRRQDFTTGRRPPVAAGGLPRSGALRTLAPSGSGNLDHRRATLH